jgi:hypothetical protein
MGKRSKHRARCPLARAPIRVQPKVSRNVGRDDHAPIPHYTNRQSPILQDTTLVTAHIMDGYYIYPVDSLLGPLLSTMWPPIRLSKFKKIIITFLVSRYIRDFAKASFGSRGSNPGADLFHPRNEWICACHSFPACSYSLPVTNFCFHHMLFG